MSLSGALSNAMSGLTANAKSTTIISSNIANAMNENYGRRDVVLATDVNATSGGVRVATTTRQSNPLSDHQKRSSAADFGQSSTFAAFASELEKLWGSVDTPGSVAGRLTKFENALIAAAGNPSSNTSLRRVASEAEDFAREIRAASDGIQAIRMRADADIATGIATVNSELGTLEKLNAQILTAKHLGQDVNGLLDQRDVSLEALSGFVPLRVVERESGEIAVFTAKGRTLLDGRAAQLDFNPTPVIAPHMTLDNALLSGLTINGLQIETGPDGMLAGGSLSASFQIRDDASVNAQRRLDAIARDVVERFGPGGPDTSLGAIDAGLFTDDGSSFNATNETGLASRLRLNASMTADDPEIWRWRDGINAMSQGEVGNASLLTALQARISAPLAPGSITLGASPRSLTEHVLNMSADVANQRVRMDDQMRLATDQLQQAREAAAVDDVNTDQELQKLIELEKAYAANARVVRVVDDMLSELLRI